MVSTQVVLKQYAEQLAAVLFLLGHLSVNPSGCAAEHFVKDVPACDHVNAECSTVGATLFKGQDCTLGLVWVLIPVVKDGGGSDHLGIQAGVSPCRVIGVTLGDQVRTGHIGKWDPVHSTTVFQLLVDPFEGLG